MSFQNYIALLPLLYRCRSPVCACDVLTSVQVNTIFGGMETLHIHTTVEESHSALEREWDFYWNNRDEIVRQYRNRYIVISDDKVVAAYDDENEAYFKTIKTIPLGSFMIHHVTDPEEIIQVSPVLGGCLL